MSISASLISGVALPCALLAAVPVTAGGALTGQDQPGQDRPVQVQPGQVADSAAGQVGQRQTREQAAPNIAPMGRVNGRIANRVQSRIRNRIDRFYDPGANAASPFVVAGEQARTAGRPPRR